MKTFIKKRFVYWKIQSNITKKNSYFISKYKSHVYFQDTKSENQLNTLNTAQILHATDNKMLKLFASHQNVNSKMENPEIQSKIYQVKSCKVIDCLRILI